METKDVIKFISGMACGLAGQAVVDTILKGMMPADLSTAKKAVWVVGKFALTGIAASACSKYAYDTIDELDDVIQAFKCSSKEA